MEDTLYTLTVGERDGADRLQSLRSPHPPVPQANASGLIGFEERTMRRILERMGTRQLEALRRRGRPEEAARVYRLLFGNAPRHFQQNLDAAMRAEARP